MQHSYAIPKDKASFERAVQEIREAFFQNLSSGEHGLMENLPFPESQIYRRINAACPVLWVAPHGYFGDALHTDYVGMVAAEMMAGSCLVNNKKFRCPLPEPGYGEIANLNDPDDSGPHAHTFIKKLFSAISIIRLKTNQSPYLVFLLNLPKASGPKIEISVATSDENHDKDDSTWISRLRQSIASDDFDISFIEKRLPQYERTLFSHLFQKQTDIGPVRLIQICLNCNEILSTETILSVSIYLSRALSYASQQEVISKNIAPLEQTSDLIEQEPDMRLVEQAGIKLTEIISRHYENAMIEAGNYLIQIFFDNDIERARKKKPVKEKSLYQLILYLQQQHNHAPSKSWLYNAVNLSVDQSDFKTFHTYGKLLLSHKVLLLQIDSKELKKNLIQEIAEKKLTISELKDRIYQMKKDPHLVPLPEEDHTSKRKKMISENKFPRLLKKSEKTGVILSKKLLQAVDQPDQLFKTDIRQHFNQQTLADISSGKRRQLLRKLQKKHTEIRSGIKQLKMTIQEHENYLHQYQNLMVEMENTLKK
ncbi:MAG: hypothetical protein HQK75_01260 [Candidatus Magnetomorum sp.]|nr:hypothetical protein [Candidatus Magnetomorum sp.]